MRNKKPRREGEGNGEGEGEDEDETEGSTGCAPHPRAELPQHLAPPPLYHTTHTTHSRSTKAHACMHELTAPTPRCSWVPRPRPFVAEGAGYRSTPAHIRPLHPAHRPHCCRGNVRPAPSTPICLGLDYPSPSATLSSTVLSAPGSRPCPSSHLRGGWRAVGVGGGRGGGRGWWLRGRVVVVPSAYARTHSPVSTPPSAPARPLFSALEEPRTFSRTPHSSRIRRPVC